MKQLVGFALLAVLALTTSAADKKQAKRYNDTTSWDPYVAKENIKDEATYLRRKFRQDVSDSATGENEAQIVVSLKRLVTDAEKSGEDWRITKARCFAYQVDHQAIDVSQLDWFPAIALWNRWRRPVSGEIGRHAWKTNSKLIPKAINDEWRRNNQSGDWNIWQDFDHSVPDWRVIMALGFPGMKTRMEKYAGAKTADGKYADPYWEGLRISMDAILSGLDRFRVRAEKVLESSAASATPARRFRLEKEIASLKRLRNGKPETAYDMMMFVWYYFMLSEHLDAIQCRSLTELDVFLTPYYEADIAAGRTTEKEFREQLKHFLWQWGSIDNYWNQPAGLGGTRADGSSEFNHVSKIVLEVIDECNLTTPKFLVKIAPNTPDWAFNKMMDMARRHRSLSFIGEEPAAKALKKWMNATDEECRLMVCRGCYEFGLRDSVNSTCAGHINFLKVMERMLEAFRKGDLKESDYPAFADFRAEYVRRLRAITARCREVALYTEKALEFVNPANMMTLSTDYAMRNHLDGFANGCRKGNNSAILAIGLGTAVDSLLAVKEIVYDRKEMSLSALGQLMADNWKGREDLRLRMLRSKCKWGNNDPIANEIGGELIASYADEINGKPNARNGKFIASGHSARQFIDLALKTGATPDGRKAGDEMSKNLSPTMGADTEGATALVETLSHGNATQMPGDYPIDMMLHPSVCAGEKGIEVMKALVRRFHKNGGSVMQFTVFSAEELKDAQRHPEKYENLQVRVCGWNVRWNDMSKIEQDKYIERAERIQH